MTTTTVTTAQELEMNVLKSKIMELQSALFYTESHSPVKLPTHVISDVEVDTEGRIWFTVPRPAQHIDAFEKEMPAKLDFFRKGKDFFVKVRGVAILMADAKTINSYESLSDDMKKKMTDKGSIGIMVKIEHTDLVDNSPKSAQSWLQSSRSHLSSWFF
jgi:general stress protein 26